MPSFIGNIEAKVDAKGRAFVPAQFRRLVDENSVFVLRKGIFDDCLVLYPEAVWEEIIGVMRQKLSRWNRKEEQVFRQFVAEANRIELEDNGRMLIPKRYIESIGIKNDIRFEVAIQVLRFGHQTRLKKPLFQLILLLPSLKN